MKQRFFKAAATALTAIFLSVSAFSQQQVQRTPFDVTNYKMDVTLNPSSNRLESVADVTFVPLESTRTVTFELNGSLKIESVSRLGMAIKANSPTATVAAPRRNIASRPATNVEGAMQTTVTFVQDQTGVSDLGPSVRVDLGENVAANTPVILRFRYSGTLVTAEGGPLLNKRLAYVGDNQGYLMYASRWFPFHDYAADRATSDITISIPAGFQIVGVSDSPVSNVSGKYRFVQSKPSLIGNFAYGKYTQKNLRFGNYDLQFYTRAANDAVVNSYAETLGKALDFYTKMYGEPNGGRRFVVVQSDDDTLDFYSAEGMLFIAPRFFEQTRQNTVERLQREAAYQWWGQTVGLKSFDDAWLSQGLAEYSAVELRESTANGSQLENMRRELIEKSLTFEGVSSIANAPAKLDDQSTAYQYVMYGKGAMVFRLLRDTLGKDKFNQLLRNFLTQYRGKTASIDDFEKLASQVKGENLRYFFARWVEGTGVPEFQVDYQIIRTRGGKFVTRGTVKQNYENLKLPLEVALKAEGEGTTSPVMLQIDEKSADFNIESNGKPLYVVIDPNYQLLRISDDLKISAVARRGIELFKEGNYSEAQQQLEAALKLDRSNSWVYYHLGLLHLEQRNYDLAVDNFKATLTGNIRPDWLSVWANIKMGNAYDAKGDRTRAVAAYQRAESLGDNFDNAQQEVKKYLAKPYDPKERQATASK